MKDHISRVHDIMKNFGISFAGMCPIGSIEPYRMARDGMTVFVLVRAYIDVKEFQRFIYPMLARNNDALENSLPGMVNFSSGGKLVIMPRKSFQEDSLNEHVNANNLNKTTYVFIME